MSHYYAQLNIHFVFAVRGRQCLIHESFRDQLQKFITGVVQNRGHKLLAIYCMPDHAHIFIGKRPTQSESDLVRDIKSNSSAFVNANGWIGGQFAWQKGYGVFSHSQSQVPTVINYILNQPEHHRRKAFKEEYVDMLQKFEIKYDQEKLANWIANGV